MAEKINHQYPLPPENIRRESQGQQSHGQTTHTLPGGGHHHQPYEFDSCISTEEAFFGQINEEIKNGYRHNSGNGSNPQEDNTPKAHPATGFHRRTVESINRGLDQQINNQNGGVKAAPGFTAANRQRTQRLSPKGKSMGRENPAVLGGQMTQGTSSPNDVRARNQSVKLLHVVQDDSQGSQKLKSDFVSSKASGGVSGIKKPPSRLKLDKRKISKMNSQGNTTDMIPQMRRRSSQALEMLMDDYSSDLGDKKSTPLYNRSGSRQSMVSPTESKKLKRLGSSKNRGGGSGAGTGSVNNGNLSRQRFYGSREVQVQEKQQPGQTESQRVMQGVGQQNGQTSMKLDMKFGWRPEFNDKDRLHRKEAIAIKLTYPNTQGLYKTSVRGCQLFTELYRLNKNQRTLRAQVKKNYIPDFPSKLIYQGYRPSVSIELHLRYGQKASFNEDSQFYDVLIPKNIKNKAIENGFHKHTPRSPVDESTLRTYEGGKDGDQPSGALSGEKQKCDLIFDSMFESGNLDLALQVQPREFNLYLKPDTNTKGYQSWFFFKVRRKPDERGKYPRRTYQFNVMNMYKKKCLYRQEARPLACNSEIMFRGFIMQELENVPWKSTQFSNIGYGLVTSQPASSPVQNNSNSNYDSQLEAIKDDTFVPNDTSAGQNNRKQKFYCLAFDFEFLSGQEFAYLASSIPYPYTFLQKTIKTCARLDQAMTTLTRSLGGLQIPMLTITNEVINISKKRTVIICGRVHPGETNSSWVLHGMIDYLISKDAGHLRDSLVFKIVPMINPDGVVAGNYRTSFIGKDLNRLYLNSDESNNMDDILKPEITAMKQLIKGCKSDDSKGVLAFIDVHHHSQKRGAFMFGPSYQMQHSKYQEVRVLPKLISMMLPEMFRFQSCRFKNQSYKENCARLYCDKEQGITYSFCLECSQQGYFSQSSQPAGHRGRHVRYFDQNSLMYLGRKICEASYMLNEMSDVQDQKRDAIQRRRKQRLFGKKGKKGVNAAASTGAHGKGANGNQSVGGRTGGNSGKGGKGGLAGGNDGTSMNGATDFDMESFDLNNSSNMSITSQDFLQNGGFNPKIGIKGFIAQMMKKMPKSGDGGLHSDSSRGALRAKNTRPLTHFGSEDAVSEKSEKEEESLSEDGSDGNSSAQDLSEDDHNQVLDEVLDQLIPNRVKKIDPVTAQITITKQVRIEPPLTRPTRKNLKSANKVILIDKKLIQKEQLLIPTAAPDLSIGTMNFQVVNSNNAISLANGIVVGNNNKNFEQQQLAKGPTPIFDDQKQIQIVPVTNLAPVGKATVGNDKSNESSYLQVQNQRQQQNQKKAIQGCYQPGPSQGYISQRQNKKRIFSGRYNKQSNKDMFANTGYMPPGAAAQRQAFAQTNLKVHYNNIYSMVQTSAAQQSYYAQQQNLAAALGGASNEIEQSQEMIHHQGSIVNRKSLRTAGNLQHSYSHHGGGSAIIAGKEPQADQPNWPISYGSEPNSAMTIGAGAQSINASSPIQVVRQSYTRTRTRASPQDFSAGAAVAGSRNENHHARGAPVVIPHVSHELMVDHQQTSATAPGIVQSSQSSGFYHSGMMPLESQWMLGQQDNQVIIDHNSSKPQQLMNQLLNTPGKPLKPIGTGVVQGPASMKHSTNTKQSMKAGGSHLLTSKDMMSMTGGQTLFTAGSVDFNQGGPNHNNFIDANHMFSSPNKPANVPLSQGGFFHRNQVIGYTDTGLEDLHNTKVYQQHSKGNPKHLSPDVIIRTTKQNTGAMTQKRKSAIATLKNLSQQQTQQQTSGPVNRISHKRQSQQLMKQLGVPPTHQHQQQEGDNTIMDAVTFDSFAIAQKSSSGANHQHSHNHHHHKRNITQTGGRYLLSNSGNNSSHNHYQQVGGTGSHGTTARFSGLVMNEDLHDRVMHSTQKQSANNSGYHLAAQQQQIYNSPQKISLPQHRIRIHSGHPKYAKTVAKKTEALIEPTISSANILSQQEPLELHHQQRQQQQQLQPKSRINLQTSGHSGATRKLIVSQMQRSNVGNQPPVIEQQQSSTNRSNQQNQHNNNSNRVNTGLAQHVGHGGGVNKQLQRSLNATTKTAQSGDGSAYIRIGHNQHAKPKF